MKTQNQLSGLLLLALSGVLSIAGCSDDGAEIPGEKNTVQWGVCPDDFANECTKVAVPLDPARPEGKQIQIFASRRLASNNAKSQVWLLQGGPGGSGNAFKAAIESFLAPAMPESDFYVLEHRGVGESERLSCPAEENPVSDGGIAITNAEWPACIDSLKQRWGQDLNHFSLTNDAEDLASLIEKTREPGKKVFVYGVSYGTARALRFLQMYPNMVDGVILDSVASPGVQFLSQYDTQYDAVGQRLADLCAADAICAEKMGPDPWAKVESVISKIGVGHCASLGIDKALTKTLFSAMVQQRDLRATLFPVVYRLDRCEAQDVQVLGYYLGSLAKRLQGGNSTTLPRDSMPLQMNVALSEMWEVPGPTEAEMVARCDQAILCPGIAASFGSMYDLWPRYSHNEYTNGWPTSKTPILAMNGDLDPQTPIELAKVAAEKLTAENQTFVTVPMSPHGVAFESMVKTPNAQPCGTQMMASFVSDPLSPVDTSCLSDIEPVSFSKSPDVVMEQFGTSDLWENTGNGFAPPNVSQFDKKKLSALLRDKARF